MTRSQRRWHKLEQLHSKEIEFRKLRMLLLKKHDIRVISSNGLIWVCMGDNTLAMFSKYEKGKEYHVRQVMTSVIKALEIKEKEGIND